MYCGEFTSPEFPHRVNSGIPVIVDIFRRFVFKCAGLNLSILSKLAIE
jgi:hypothetical protein